MPPETWSDDGAQALCLLASLLECGRLDTDDLARRLLAWYERGYMAVDGTSSTSGPRLTELVNGLRGKEIVEPLIEKLIEVVKEP